ncbi:MAG: (d)CMP kinase, partial [SAR324 cluster bacterium]|nr:(d)CMP kinase [SAR324 cluster bacterium]
YLTATIDIRRRRRGITPQALKQRDEQDRNRSEAPLRKAADAILVDTSNLNVEQVLSVLEQHLQPFLLTESS